MRGYGHIRPCVRYRRQAQAYLPGHLFLGGRHGRRGCPVHQDGRIFRHAEDRESGTEVFGEHRQLLRFHASVLRPCPDLGRRLCHSQAGHLREEAFCQRGYREAGVPF